MNKTINKVLLTRDKFMPELHLTQPGFNYNACRPFTKHRQRIQNFRETGNLNHAYKNKLDKYYFARYTAYSNRKDLAKRTVSNKILKKRFYEIAINPKYDGYQRGLPSMVYKFLDNKIGLGAGASVNEPKNYTNQ